MHPNQFLGSIFVATVMCINTYCRAIQHKVWELFPKSDIIQQIVHYM